MKLTPYEKAKLAALKADFKEAGGRFAFLPEAGITVAVRPAFKGAKFVQVATAYSDGRDDQFKKKCGKFLVLDRLSYGQSVPMALWGRSPDELALDILQAAAAEYL